MAASRGTTPFHYCGRSFTKDEIELIRGITDDPRYDTRAAIARAVCAALDWTKPDGLPKVVSCQVALQRMEAHGVIWLPLPTREAAPFRPVAPTTAGEPGTPITGALEELTELRLALVDTLAQARLWNELIQRYHYLGRGRSAGAQARYLAYDGDRLLGALGFGASAWRLADRDHCIGWTDAEREAHLHLVVQNRRFLVLPWVDVHALASRLLTLAARRLPGDWERRAGYRPVLLETFVERARFRGTSYAAAHWLRVGQTKGRGRNDRHKQGGQPIRDIWLYVLDPRCRELLTGGRISESTIGPQGRQRA